MTHFNHLCNNPTVKRKTMGYDVGQPFLFQKKSEGIRCVLTGNRG